jgi:hypothetical protein
MMAALSDRLALAYKSYNDEYAELCDTWRALDQKSQGCLQTAGVMIALLAAFSTKAVEPLPATNPIVKFAIGLSAISFMLLWVSALFSIFALYVQRVSHAPRGSGWEDIKVFTATPQLGEQIETDILSRQLTAWRQTNENVWEINESKAKHLSRSQFWLAGASTALTVAVVVFLTGLLWDKLL